MPIYEYRCQNCGRRISIFWRSFSEVEASPPRCPFCGGENLARLISRVSTLKSEESHLEDLASPESLAGLDENDPKSIARWMRRMSRETGEDLGPEFEEVVDRLEAGQRPEEIEKSMPDLGGEAPAPSEL
ncbi:MAG: FmdB family zinc ribbon protein [Chloroflexota bacterium]|nr:FmdB family zinc ribbon protein [Chloroflexota bacterium]